MSSAENLNQDGVLARNAGADSPFGKHRGNRSRWLALVAFAVSLGITAFLVSRFRGGQRIAHTAKQSQVTTASTFADGPQPIMLAGKGEQRIGVTFATATMAPLSREVRSAAQVTFDETRVKTIAPKVDGWVEQLYVNYVGQSLHAGDPVLSIYSPMLVSAQQELLLSRHLRTEMINATPEAKEAAANLEESARRRLLYWDVSAADVDRLLATGEVRKALTLRSPSTGVVLEKAVLGGQKVMAGEALYKVADLSVVWLEGEVFERDLPLVRLGETVSADFDALPGSQRSGRISYIYPTVNPETRTVQVRVSLPNPGLALKPGMYATIRISGGGGEAVLIVPRSSVLSTGERNLVFVKRPDGMLEPHPVVLGISNDEQVQILSGLTAGDTVVASATFLVDAESNLGSVLGGMGNMPGMDITKPVAGGGGADSAARPVAPAPRTKPPERR
jgi:Cu(I)/Ag(I) efflux system membrane fusion protein